MNTDNLVTTEVRLLNSRIRELVLRRGRLRRRRAEAACVDVEISRLGDEITHRRDHLAIVASTGSYQSWTRHHFRLGDFARVGGIWYPVLHAGWSALTVVSLDLRGERRRNRNGEPAPTDSVAYFRVYGRRRAGRVLHIPPPAEDATCTCRVTIPTFNPEFVPERDAGPCTEPPVARLTIRHDGTECGCDGTCLLPDTDSADTGAAGPASRPPWIDVVLLCDTHAYEYAATDAVTESSAISFEELT